MSLNIIIMDKDRNFISPLDTYTSIIWHEKYREPGDFEIYAPYALDSRTLLSYGNLVYLQDYNYMGIIEQYEIKFEEEVGYSLIVKGRSMYALLDRRILVSKMDVVDSLNSFMATVFDDNITTPYNPARIIPGLYYIIHPDINPDVDYVFGYDNICDIVQKICIDHKLGFKIEYNSDQDILLAQFYEGSDRSYEQYINPYVVFSKEYENINAITYYLNTSAWKTYCMVEGWREDAQTAVFSEASSGETSTDRREVYLDKTSMSYPIDGLIIPPYRYDELLAFAGKSYINKTRPLPEFSTDIDYESIYIFGTDYNLGDIVQIDCMDILGITFKARITGVIISEDTTGKIITPEYEIIQN